MTARRKRPTLNDIAADTGLSPAAVSYALRGLQVPEQTQERVRESAERLGYEAHPAARALASGRTGSIGVMCGSLQDLWQQSLVAALGRALLAVDLNALIVDIAGQPDREPALAARLADQRVDALVTVAVDPRGAHWAEVAGELPVVAIGDDLPAADTAAQVLFCNTSGVGSGLRQLADAGHRHVLVLTPGRGGVADRPADRAVARQAPELGLEAELRNCPYDLAGATELAATALAADPPPTAFFCLTDSMAYGVYAAAQRAGLHIPGDISVLGYDDHPMSHVLSPPLSTYRWEVTTIVQAAVERLLAALEAGEPQGRVVLQPEPQPRESVGPPHG